jgi:hypothetical protein
MVTTGRFRFRTEHDGEGARRDVEVRGHMDFRTLGPAGERMIDDERVRR